MRCPLASWRGSPNETPHGMIAHRGMVLHIQQSSSEAGTDSWFHDPKAQASAHFGVAFDGSLDQWVDTDDKAWAESAGNPYWISVEIEGFSGKSATAAQVATLGRLFAWCRANYPGIPAVATDDPNGAGLGWHGMGGSAWGGHLDCPGEPIKAQRPAILAAAKGSPAPTPAPVPLAPATPEVAMYDPKGRCVALIKPDGSVATYNADGSAGGHYLGGLNNHPAYNAGAGKPEGPAVAITPWDDALEAWSGYVIWTEDGTGAFHGYAFPSDGRHAAAGK